MAGQCAVDVVDDDAGGADNDTTVEVETEPEEKISSWAPI
jgi:hypothetical protein